MVWLRVVVEALKALVGRRISNERQVSALIREGSEAVTQASGRLELAASTVKAMRKDLIDGVYLRIRTDVRALQKEMVAEIVKAAVPRFQAEIARSLRAEVLGLSELFTACATLVEIGRDRTQSQWGGGERVEDTGGATAEGKDVRSTLESWVLEHTGRGPVGPGGAQP